MEEKQLATLATCIYNTFLSLLASAVRILRAFSIVRNTIVYRATFLIIYGWGWSLANPYSVFSIHSGLCSSFRKNTDKSVWLKALLRGPETRKSVSRTEFFFFFL